MNSKTFLSIQFFLLLFVQVNAQMESSISYTSRDKFILKSTGEVITHRQLQSLKKENELTLVLPVINADGMAEYFQVDSSNHSTSIKMRDKEMQPVIGEVFPPFNMKSEKGTVRLSDFSENGVVVIFQELFDSRLTEVTKFDELLNLVLSESPLDIVIVSRNTIQEIRPHLQQFDSDRLIVVPDAYNFFLRYQIFTMPTTAIIGPDSKLILFEQDREFDRIKAAFASMKD